MYSLQSVMPNFHILNSKMEIIVQDLFCIPIICIDLYANPCFNIVQFLVGNLHVSLIFEYTTAPMQFTTFHYSPWMLFLEHGQSVVPEVLMFPMSNDPQTHTLNHNYNDGNAIVLRFPLIHVHMFSILSSRKFPMSIHQVSGDLQCMYLQQIQHFLD